MTRAVPLPITPTKPNGEGVKSCAGCPSQLGTADTRAALGTQIGGPVCSIRLIPTSRPSQPLKIQQRTENHLANNCDFFGTPRQPIDRNATIAPIMFGEVALPAPQQKTRESNGRTPVAPANCNGCVNYIPASQVSTVTGWTAPLCSATGNLLLGDRLSTYPEVCGQAASRHAFRDDSRPDINKVVWLPEFTNNFGDVDKAALAKKMRSVDPASWPSDKPVTDKQKARGIKAWRKLVDPAGVGAEVFLPIYDIDQLPEDLRHLVPQTGDDEHPELYIDHAGLVYTLAVLWTKIDLTPAAWGPPGVGKTELARHMAWLMRLPFHRISITGSTEIDDLAGKMHYDPDKGTYFQYGRLPKRWSQPGVIIIDEPNVGPNEVWQFIRPLTDNSRQLVLDQNNGERVNRHDDCYFMMAMNPAYDARNVGTNTISDADARRLLHISMDLPPETVEREIIKNWCALDGGYDPSEHLDKVMKIAVDIRANCDQGALPISWGIASNVKVARLLQYFGPMEAYRIAILNYLDPAAADVVSDIIKTLYPV